MKNLWRPISELDRNDLYSPNLLLRAPELVNLDCNEHGVAPGYYQDDRDRVDHNDTREDDLSGWVAAGYDLHRDEWVALKVTPTHFMMIEGPKGEEPLPHFEDPERYS